MLPQVERRQVEAEDLRATFDVAQAPVGQSPHSGADQSAAQEGEIGAVAADVRVGAVAARQGGLEVQPHEAELLPPRLPQTGAPRAGRHVGQTCAVLLEGRIELGEPGEVHAVGRDGQLAPEIGDVAQGAPNRGGPVALQRGARHVGGHPGVAVAIASDPRSPAEERPHLEALAGIRTGQRVFELADDRRRHVEERALEDVEACANLVERRRPRGARLLGAIEGADRRAKLAEHLRAIPRGEARIVEAIEVARDFL